MVGYDVDIISGLIMMIYKTFRANYTGLERILW